MLELFRRKVAAPLNPANVSLVRSHTRALIRCANVVDTAGSRDDRQGATTRRSSEEWQAMKSCEVQLAASIAAAVFDDVGIQVIVQDVIRPILREAIILSETADDAVARAVIAAQRA
jgi:hypothetical protein